jgi:hypothetical protein
MARPNKIYEDTKVYNLSISIVDWDKLSHIAKEETEIHGTQVSVADMIRSIVKSYLEAYEEVND